VWLLDVSIDFGFRRGWLAQSQDARYSGNPTLLPYMQYFLDFFVFHVWSLEVFGNQVMTP
jgi:hypothetical protein